MPTTIKASLSGELLHGGISSREILTLNGEKPLNDGDCLPEVDCFSDNPSFDRLKEAFSLEGARIICQLQEQIGYLTSMVQKLQYSIVKANENNVMLNSYHRSYNHSSSVLTNPVISSTVLNTFGDSFTRENEDLFNDETHYHKMASENARTTSDNAASGIRQFPSLKHIGAENISNKHFHPPHSFPPLFKKQYSYNVPSLNPMQVFSNSSFTVKADDKILDGGPSFTMRTSSINRNSPKSTCLYDNQIQENNNIFNTQQFNHHSQTDSSSSTLEGAKAHLQQQHNRQPPVIQQDSSLEKDNLRRAGNVMDMIHADDTIGENTKERIRALCECEEVSEYLQLKLGTVEERNKYIVFNTNIISFYLQHCSITYRFKFI